MLRKKDLGMEFENEEIVMRNEKIVIIGGGSSAHVLVPFLSKKYKNISIVTSKPLLWKNKIVVEWQNIDGSIKKSFEGNLKKASSNISELVPDADIIIFCMPVYKYNEALESIAPYISKSKKVLLGTIYGQGGFNWMVNSIKKKYSLFTTKVFAIGLIPWIARIKEYGSIGITYGPKAVNIIAFEDKNDFIVHNVLLNTLCFDHFNTGKFKLAENFLSLILSVDNQIIHTSRMYGLYKVSGGKWNTLQEVPYFYRDYDDLSADFLALLDNDYSKIRNKIIEMFPQNNFEYMLNYLDLERLSYQSCNENIKQSFIDSQTLGAIKTPVIRNNNFYELDKDHRFFYDDIYYGLVIAKWVAQKLDIEVNVINEILKWSEMMLEDNILIENELNFRNLKLGSPNRYGLEKLEEIIQ
jgi:hypothetical protein